jgi:hypothetical protein
MYRAYEIFTDDTNKAYYEELVLNEASEGELKQFILDLLNSSENISNKSINIFEQKLYEESNQYLKNILNKNTKFGIYLIRIEEMNE